MAPCLRPLHNAAQFPKQMRAERTSATGGGQAAGSVVGVVWGRRGELAGWDAGNEGLLARAASWAEGHPQRVIFLPVNTLNGPRTH